MPHSSPLATFWKLLLEKDLISQERVVLLLLVLVSALRNGVGGGGGCGGTDGAGAGVGAGAECGLRVVEDYDQKNLLMFFCLVS